jgi:hypothetical protein
VNKITLHVSSPREVEISGQLIAELQRQGLAFTVSRENVTSLSGLGSTPGLVVTVTGY